jgi:DNA-binding transcriptional LysR family regulator
MIDWGDLRVFLAVARTGSAAAAGREMGVNQTTVARRVAALEEALGARLFDRRREGYVLRADAAGLLATAEAAENQAAAFVEQARALGRGLERLRITTNDSFANLIVAPAIQAFQAEHPDVRVEIVVATRKLDLDRGEADIALRAAPEPDPGDLIARRLVDGYWAVYCSAGYGRTPPAGLADLADHTLLTLGHDTAARLVALAPATRHEVRDSMTELLVAVRAGQGVASLPCIVGDNHPDFVRCFAQDDPVSPVWLIHHARLKGSPPARRFLDLVAEHTLAVRDRLQGRQPAT